MTPPHSKLSGGARRRPKDDRNRPRDQEECGEARATLPSRPPPASRKPGPPARGREKNLPPELPRLPRAHVPVKLMTSLQWSRGQSSWSAESESPEFVNLKSSLTHTHICFPSLSKVWNRKAVSFCKSDWEADVLQSVSDEHTTANGSDAAQAEDLSGPPVSLSPCSRSAL